MTFCPWRLWRSSRRRRRSFSKANWVSKASWICRDSASIKANCSFWASTSFSNLIEDKLDTLEKVLVFCDYRRCVSRSSNSLALGGGRSSSSSSSSSLDCIARKNVHVLRNSKQWIFFHDSAFGQLDLLVISVFLVSLSLCLFFSFRNTYCNCTILTTSHSFHSWMNVYDER